MARIDSMLSILAQQAGDELRLGTDREPQLLARGVPKRLTIAATPEETLRELLEEVLSPERERGMRERGHLDVVYESAALGRFRVKLSARPGQGFDVVFLRESGAPARRAPPVLLAEVPRRPDPQPIEANRLEVHRMEGQRIEGPRDDGRRSDAPSPRDPPRAGLVSLVAAAAALRGTDVHLAEGQVPVVRVHGALRPLGEEVVDLAELLALSSADREALGRGRTIDSGIDVPGAGRVRLHVFLTADGLAAAARILPSAAPSLASLDLSVPLDDVVHLAHGLVLVCGSSGSGKSTTLAALAQEILRRRSIALVTLEDPIEYALSGSASSLVRRRQVSRHVPTFAAGLRDALREDPDVLLVGEMRDPETIGLALTAAETGHLVLSSLHSGAAASAVERIVDAYPPERQQQARVQLADSLRLVVAQRLLPRKDGAGRVVAAEVLRVTHAVAALIREGKTAQIASAIQAGKREGMVPLEKSLADRVRAGAITPESARQTANDADSLAMYLR